MMIFVCVQCVFGFHSSAVSLYTFHERGKVL